MIYNYWLRLARAQEAIYRALEEMELVDDDAEATEEESDDTAIAP